MVSLSFRPKLLDTLKGYSRREFTADLIAGVTVGIVALPLAMAFAIASVSNLKRVFSPRSSPAF